MPFARGGADRDVAGAVCASTVAGSSGFHQAGEHVPHRVNGSWSGTRERGPIRLRSTMVEVRRERAGFSTVNSAERVVRTAPRPALISATPTAAVHRREERWTERVHSCSQALCRALPEPLNGAVVEDVHRLRIQRSQ